MWRSLYAEEKVPWRWWGIFWMLFCQCSPYCRTFSKFRSTQTCARNLHRLNSSRKCMGLKFTGGRDQNTKSRKRRQKFLITPRKNSKSWKTATRQKRLRKKRTDRNLIDPHSWFCFLAYKFSSKHLKTINTHFSVQYLGVDIRYLYSLTFFINLG